ncbi:MAG TPA: hypothetical protein VK176_13405 [Phycisphaerales bacterium]|nr:hypothetical protein [Phycisphaerales bacterium]
MQIRRAQALTLAVGTTVALSLGAMIAGGALVQPASESSQQPVEPGSIQGQPAKEEPKPQETKPQDSKPQEAATEPAKDAKPAPKLNAGTFGALSARSLGPSLMSGRIADLAVNPENHSEFYVAVASGGVWKTTNGGVSFNPIFDGYGSYSIGCITIDPTNSKVVWVGSGENNSQRSVGFGDGIYVSRNGGQSFQNVGLGASEHIGMIRVDPRNSQVVYAAAMGPLWSDGGDRGVYKTVDGGKTWERVLHISDMTGVNEIHMDPRDPDVLYATAYQRRRHVWTLINGGPESGIHKSTDGGKTWRAINSGLPGGDKGRIGLCISPADPDVLYAIVEAAEGAGGIYRSRDRGETWERRNGYMTSSPQYYNELFADPKNPDRFYTIDTVPHMSDDGGATMRPMALDAVHVDFHVLWIDPSDTDHILGGCDGGLYETFNRGQQWRHTPNLPVVQFYRVATDNALPFYNVYGGTQDNNTYGGPSRTTDSVGISNEMWFETVGGDGFEPAIDPKDPNIVYSQWQHAGLIRFNRQTGEQLDIKPREKPGDQPYVWNWDTPLLISPHNNHRLYIASRVLHRSDDRGGSWRVISPDLTRGIDRNQLKVMGVIQKPEAVAKHASTSIYGNCVSLTESPKVEGLLYVGTDDGLVHVTEDGGTTWRKIESFPDVPTNTYVSELESSVHNPDRIYAAFDNHKNGDFKPYLLRSDDRGRTWTSIAGDLPARDICYTVAEDHVNPDLLFVGTEFGCYYTLNGGKNWYKVAGLPTIPVRDLEIQRRENDLVMATFGRGFYVLDNYTPLRDASEALLERPTHFFAVKPALSYLERSRMGGGRGSQGSTYYAAPNPPFGAVITYWMKEKVTSRKDRRKEAQGKDGWTYPTMDDFRAEDTELDPQVFMTIRDSAGTVMRRMAVSREAGIQRVTWDLRTHSTYPAGGGGVPGGEGGGGPLVPPGTYSVQLSRIVDGVITEISDKQNFEVVDLNASSMAAKGQDRTEKFAFEQKTGELNRALQAAIRVASDAQDRISELRRATSVTPGMDQAVLKELHDLRAAFTSIQTRLTGDRTVARRYDPEPISISDRVGTILGGLAASTEPPTPTQREQYAYAADEFAQVLAGLKEQLAALERVQARFDPAGAPWTSGRLPDWKR